MARQVTLFTEKRAHDFARKACTAHLEQMRRQATEPAPSKVSPGLRRTLSFPAAPTFQTIGEIEALIEHERAEGDDSGSDDGLSLESSQASSHDELEGGSPITQAIISAVDRCNSSLAVATPGGGVTAVSKKLAAMTGYTCEALLSFGAECPALMHCLEDELLLETFRQALDTGGNFASLFVSRKHSGDLFLNLVHVRGLTLARGADGEDIWILLMAFADVTGWERQSLPSDHSRRLEKLARRIEKSVQKEMAGKGFQHAFGSSGDGLQLMSTFTFKPGLSGVPGPCEMLDHFLLRSDLASLGAESKSENTETGESPKAVTDFGNFPWIFGAVIVMGLAVVLRRHL